jgi:hypothetical protein
MASAKIHQKLLFFRPMHYVYSILANLNSSCRASRFFITTSSDENETIKFKALAQIAVMRNRFLLAYPGKSMSCIACGLQAVSRMANGIICVGRHRVSVRKNG